MTSLNFQFAENNPAKAIDSIRAQMELQGVDMKVSFELSGNDLTVTIQKLGTTVLFFEHQSRGEAMVWSLAKEKIGFTHRPFKADVFSKLVALVGDAGGTVV